MNYGNKVENPPSVLPGARGLRAVVVGIVVGVDGLGLEARDGVELLAAA